MAAAAAAAAASKVSNGVTPNKKRSRDPTADEVLMVHDAKHNDTVVLINKNHRIANPMSVGPYCRPYRFIRGIVNLNTGFRLDTNW